jgi:menaquinone-specific isochorismate synthase
MRDFLKAGGFLGHRPGRILLFHGPFSRVATPPSGRPALYAPDFFLGEETPWHVAERFEDLSLADFRRRLGTDLGAPPDLDWSEPDRDAYTAVFECLHRRIESGWIVKAVPVVFATAHCPDPRRTLLPHLIRSASNADDSSVPYGVWDAAGGLVGATPEVLFEQAGDGVVHSMALAGTAASEEAAARLAASKERAEHRIVLDEVVSSLSEFGRVEHGRTETVSLPHLTHLRTEITLHANRPAPFVDLVKALHPTPALGGAPRDRSLAWLSDQDRDVHRHRFGAPFGYSSGDGTGRCVVAIRCIQWSGDAVRVGAGAGVVAESRLEREWAELKQKRDAVRKMLLP